MRYTEYSHADHRLPATFVATGLTDEELHENLMANLKLGYEVHQVEPEPITPDDSLHKRFTLVMVARHGST